jgi:AcrR family transcriptional regulator
VEFHLPRTPRRAAARKPRWRRRPEARPEEILEAALDVFGELGFARTRLDDVARRAGVSKGTLYLYFDSKEALFRAMVQAKVETVLTESEALVRNWQGTTTELLRHFIRRYWELMNRLQNCRLARVVLSELSSFPELARFHYRNVILRVRRVIESIIEQGIARGEFRPVQPVFAARMLQTLCVQLAQFLVYFAPYDPAPPTAAETLAAIEDLYLNALLARPAAPES